MRGRIGPLRKLVISVSRAVKNANNVDSVGRWYEEDHIAAERHASKTGRKFVTWAPDEWLRCPETELLVQTIHPTVCFDEAVVGDEVPNVEYVRGGLRATSCLGHSGGACLGGAPRPSRSLDLCSVPICAGPTLQAAPDITAKLFELRLA